jgi:adenylate cyclase
LEREGLLPTQHQASVHDEEHWRKLLTEGHQKLHLAHLLFRYIPSAPRCKVCHNPFGGLGGKLVGLFGFNRSRKNPNLCSRCCDTLHPGGAELDVAVLFADVRGSTAMGERMEPGAFAAAMNRFYNAATEVLVRADAIIDKLIGDEVMALFIPGICGPEYHRRAAEAALALLQTVSDRRSPEPSMPIGVGVHSGITYVGNVGSAGVVDFTALGDTVNTAARLASSAGAGEALLSEPIYDAISAKLPDLERRMLEIRGKEAPLAVRVLRAASPN